MRFESEVVVNDVLPAIRSILAKRLSSDYGYTQEEIAVKLDLTQPAVSQYINSSRADPKIIEEMQEDHQINLLLDEAVSEAAKDEDFSSSIGQVIQTVRDKGLLREKFRDTKRL